MHVDDHFLLASVSKIYCVAAVKTLMARNQLALNTAVKTLMARNQLALNTAVYSRLGYTSQYATDPRVFNITVQNLLDHLGGDDSWHNGNDPAYSMRNIAQTMSNGSHPATVREIVEWKLRQPLDFNPGDVSYCESHWGSNFCYSNYGFILLSYLVENVTSTDYYSWLEANILKPQGYQVSRWLTEPQAHVNDVVKQLDPTYGLSALHPQDPNPVPFIYGGDGMYKESDMGGAALATSAGTLTKTVASWPVWAWEGTRTPGFARIGSTPGAYAYVTSRWDGLDVAMVFNTRAFDTDLVDNSLYPQLDQFLTNNPPS